MKPTVLLLSSLDTRYDETLYAKTLLEEHSCNVILMDVSLGAHKESPAEYSCVDVAKEAGVTFDIIRNSKGTSEPMDHMIKGATKISQKLHAQGVEAEVLEVGAVRRAADYDAFVVGSALYMFHWLKDARRFISTNSEVLASHPVWLFSSGPVGTRSTNAEGRDVLEVSGPKELDELRELVRPRDHEVFFGALDGSRLTGIMGFGYRMARKSKSARDEMPEGDFRDWKAIETWTAQIVQDLKAP